MATRPFPLVMPEDLLDEVREVAADTGLSNADVIRQSVKLGLPRFRDQHKATAGLKPFTKAEARRAFAPDPEWDRLEAHMAKVTIHRRPETD